MQKRWRFLRKQSKIIIAWIVGASVIGILGWTLLFHTLNKQVNDIDAATRLHVAAMSRGYAEQLARMLEAVDQTILHVRYEWNLTSGQLRLDLVPDQGLFPPASLFFVAVIDQNGDVLTSTISDSERLNVSDKSYFTAHIQGTVDKLYFAPPAVTHTVGANVLQFSRRIVGYDGNFQGVVLAAVAPRYLTSSYDMNALGTNGFLGIIGNDHAVRVTRIGEKVHSAAAFAFSNTPPFLSERGTELLNGDQWFSDKRSRYIAWEPVNGYPIFAITGLDEIQVYASHDAYRRRAIIAALALTSFLGLITIIAVISSLRLAWRKEAFETVRTAYRMATEDGNEGFYIARPVKGGTGAILDFDIIDCNQRGAAFFKLRHDELVGRRISRSRFGMVLDGHQTILWEALESGASQTEVEVPQSLNLGPTWLHVKAVRVDEEIAITLYDMSSAKAHIKELERREHVDSLTGLFNRQWIRTYLPEVVDKAKANNDMLAVLHLDLDGFKAINDAMGHACGDELLRAAADRLCAVVRPQDNVIRATSDEFLVLVGGLPDSREAAMIAERAVTAFKDGFKLSQGYQRVGVSIGISVFPQDAADADNLLAYADIAMFSAKKGGKGTYRFYDPHFYETMRRRFETENDLRRAIEHDEFVMYYQPRVNIQTGATSSMESLVRWMHPKRGLVNPTEFVPLAEETGLIVGMGSLIIDKVCRQIGEWQNSGQPVLPVSINVSPRQFTETDVVALFKAAIKKYNLNPDLVEIEVTESSMMGDDERVLQTLSRLQAMGIKLLVDDFGTGYSSLSQLQRMDFDVLKVDRSFTCQIDRTNEGNIFVKAIITMAHALGMTVVAEGVENEEQLRILKSLACDEIQGFYISRPLPAAERQPILPRYFLRSVA